MLHVTKQHVVYSIASLGAAALTFLLLPTIKKSILRRQLRYQEWIHSQKSRYSRFHVSLVRFLVQKNPPFQSLQDVLPVLPIPKLEATLNRYLKSVHAFLPDVDFARTLAAVKDFDRGVGDKLQKELIALGKKEARAGRSWLEKMWRDNTYLRNRSSIVTASTWYVTDQPSFDNPSSIVSRASRVMRALCEFYLLMASEEINATVTPVPLCMHQYTRLFSTTRLPGKDIDEIVHYSPSVSRHIIVARKGAFYVVPAFHATGDPLNVDEIAAHLQHIIADADKSEGNLPIGVLTSANRSTWASNREKLMSLSSENKVSIQVIESSLFCVSLEDSSPTNLNDLGRTVWVGNGRNRWFDKSFTLVVTENGQAGFAAEHSYCDAMVVSHMADYAFSLADGAVMSGDDLTAARPVLANPKRLKITADDGLKAEVVSAMANLDRSFGSIALHHFDFRNFGKRFLKTCNLSPDAFIQLSLQLAYFRLTGTFTPTYETAHTRVFFHGRTETVQSCSDQAVACVLAMVNPDATRESRYPLLVRALESHVEQTRNAMIGRGFYRHLFALHCLAKESKGLHMPALFTDLAYTLPWNLVTAQTSAQRVYHSGFAPWGPEGFGVSYFVNDNAFRFQVSCHKSASHTAQKFAQQIERALIDLQSVVWVDSKLKKYPSLADLSEIRGPGWQEDP